MALQSDVAGLEDMAEGQHLMRVVDCLEALDTEPRPGSRQAGAPLGPLRS